MDAWAWSKRVGELLADIPGTSNSDVNLMRRGVLIVGTGSAGQAAEIAEKHGLRVAEINGFLRPGAFIVVDTIHREARGGMIDG
jgi:hypothetical protein